MAKKTTKDIPQKAELLVSREEFAKELDQRIELGRKVQELPVEVVSRFSYGNGGYGRASQTPEYNEEHHNRLRFEFSKWNDYNCELLKQRFSIPGNEYQKRYAECGQAYFITSLSDTVKLLREELAAKINNLETLKDKLPLLPVAATVGSGKESAAQEEARSTSRKPINSADSKKVFIVHGHDRATRLEVENLMKDLGYNPIVLFKQADQGRTIIEKLENETSDVCFAIVIYSHCDDGKAKEEVELKPRARQNVVFEHGMMSAILGRSRVVALLEPGVEQPGDLQGVIYTPLDAFGSWRYTVAREMRAAGLPVDLNLIK